MCAATRKARASNESQEKVSDWQMNAWNLHLADL